MAVGAQLFGQGDYAAAGEALSRGLSKGEVEKVADVQLTIAIAMYRSGKKMESLKMLREIRPDNKAMQKIVELWILYVQ